MISDQSGSAAPDGGLPLIMCSFQRTEMLWPGRPTSTSNNGSSTTDHSPQTSPHLTRVCC
eukprot:scaffold44444_cov27-Tisochrysis_lutea.AAC.1